MENFIRNAKKVVLGPVIPDEWQIGFIVPLMFIAVLVPALRTLPAIAAMGIAIAVTLLFKDIPHGLNVLIGALTGIALGALVPDRKPRANPGPASASEVTP